MQTAEQRPNKPRRVHELGPVSRGGRALMGVIMIGGGLFGLGISTVDLFASHGAHWGLNALSDVFAGASTAIGGINLYMGLSGRDI